MCRQGHPYQSRAFPHHPHGNCCCHFTTRRFFAKEEQIAQLEGYLEELQAETREVEKRIKEIKES